jgi:hypothetical protein
MPAEPAPGQVATLVAEAEASLAANAFRARLLAWFEVELARFTVELGDAVGERFLDQVPDLTAAVLRELADQAEQLPRPGDQGQGG